MFKWDSFLSEEAKLRNRKSESAPTNGLILSRSTPSKENLPLRGISLTFQTPQSNFTELKTITKDPLMGRANPEVEVITQYLASSGLATLNKWIKDYITKLHKPQFDWDIVIQGGSTHSLDCIFRTIMNPNEDTILADELSYTGFLEACAPLRIKVFPIRMTDVGVDPADMDRVLRNWEKDHPGVKKPKAYYAMPTGHNPTGITMGLQVRKDVLDVCKKHNILIIEDDVFYHLNMKSSLPPSILELDTEGRVLRVDSFSKMLMPGMRVSMVTCNPVFHEKLLSLNECSIGAASPPSQLLLATILNDWGSEGFEKWLDHINIDYRAKRDNMLQALDKFIPSNLVTHTRPQSGMVVWFTLEKHQWPVVGENHWFKIENRVWEKTRAKGVVVGKGHGFLVDPTMEICSWRVAYSFLTLDQMQQAVEVFANAISETHKELYS